MDARRVWSVFKNGTKLARVSGCELYLGELCAAECSLDVNGSRSHVFMQKKILKTNLRCHVCLPVRHRIESDCMSVLR